jgi:hypothetical protein
MVKIMKLHIVYWQNEGTQHEVKIILPELYLERQHKSNNIEELYHQSVDNQK